MLYAFLRVTTVLLLSVTSVQSSNNFRGGDTPSSRNLQTGNVTSDIFGGRDTDANEYPFYAQKYWRGEFRGCAASLIASKWLLTAAHCVEGDDQFGGISQGYLEWQVSAYCRSGDENGPNCGARETWAKTTKILVHPKWDFRQVIWDFALVELDKTVDEIPVSIDDGSKFAELKKDERVQTIGMGYVNDKNELPEILQEAVNFFLEPEVCVKNFPNALDESVMCTIGFDTSTCRGDSGSLAMVPASSPSQWLQVGTTSFGIMDGCRPHEYPEAYARTATAYDWIEENVCPSYGGTDDDPPKFCAEFLTTFVHPTAPPSLSPSQKPSDDPTSAPTDAPSQTPASKPTNLPTVKPTTDPTRKPTVLPTNKPTHGPTQEPTYTPSDEPTREPVAGPTREPVAGPTREPVAGPTREPVAEPTLRPTFQPTHLPTSNATHSPTSMPSSAPSDVEKQKGSSMGIESLAEVGAPTLPPLGSVSLWHNSSTGPSHANNFVPSTSPVGNQTLPPTSSSSNATKAPRPSRSPFPPPAGFGLLPTELDKCGSTDGDDAGENKNGKEKKKKKKNQNSEDCTDLVTSPPERKKCEELRCAKFRFKFNNKRQYCRRIKDKSDRKLYCLKRRTTALKDCPVSCRKCEP